MLLSLDDMVVHLPHALQPRSLTKPSCFPAMYPLCVTFPNGQGFQLHHLCSSQVISATLFCTRLASSPTPLPFPSQLAIHRYKLFNLRAEFFINTCNLPVAYDSSTIPVELAGLPVFSTEHSEGSIDILYPDPVDLTGGYLSLGRKSVSLGHSSTSWVSHETCDSGFDSCSTPGI